MKIAFRFENGTSECILTPENARDKSYIDLCIDGRSEIKLKPTTSDSIILSFSEVKPKSIEPQVLSVSEYLTNSACESEKCLCGGVGCNTCEPQGRG